jgi:hypothetical protein
LRFGLSEGEVVRFLLDQALNFWAGWSIVVGASVWTVLSIALTSEPANVLAMSGVALVIAGLLIVQGALQMRKIDDAGASGA